MILKLVFTIALSLAPLSVNGDASIPFSTSQVKNVLTPTAYTINGVVEAVKKATLSAEVSGRVTEVNFDVGDFVNENDILVRIRDKEYKAQLNSAKATLKEANANYKDAKSEFKRVEGLYREKVVSTSNLDSARALLKSTEARVSASKAHITEVQEKLDNTIIRAPFSGVVTKRYTETGETIRIGQAIMAGFSTTQLRISTDVSQNYIDEIRKYQTAVILNSNTNNKTIKAVKLTIFPVANPKTHTFQVRALLPENIENLYPGMLVKISFKIGEQNRLLIPTTAIVYRSEVAAVYVINNKKMIFRQIREGRKFAKNTEILAGLDENETIANNPIRAGVYLKRQAESSK